jgi:DNA polymerase III subunit delta'
MSLDDVLDQPVAVRFARNIVERSRVPSGLLFHGPGGVGKRLLAAELAKSIMTIGIEPDSTEAALVKRRIDHGNHPDLRWVAPTKKSRIIDVEAIDDVIEMASLRPFEAAWRVFVITEADRMRGPAQNHLLKTLEEPLGQSLFILITEFPQLLLPTIRSRCQRIRFGRLRPETVAALLRRERSIGEAAADAIAAVAQGQMSRALEFVDTDTRGTLLDWLTRLEAGDEPLAIAEEFTQFLQARKVEGEARVREQSDPVDAKEMSKEDRERFKAEQEALVDALHRRDILEVLHLMETWYRDVMVMQATGDASRVLNRDQAARLKAASPEGVEGKIEALEKARIYLERFLSEDRVFRDLFFALAPAR